MTNDLRNDLPAWTVHVLIPVAFFVSGATALLYQIVWFDSFAILMGKSTYASAAVVSVFMGGLSMGSFVVGRIVDATNRSMRTYGLLELGIGTTAWYVPHALHLFDPLFTYVYRHMAPSGVGLTILRLSIAVVVLIIPTMLMGGTFAVVTKISTHEHQQIGSKIGLLYGLNTFGAVVGCCATGFVLIETLGPFRTLLLGSTVNAALGIFVLLVESRIPVNRTGEASFPPISPRKDKRRDATQKIALLVLFLSGFASLSYEILCARILDFAMVRGSSIYSFTVTLATFLMGNAVGSAICALLDSNGLRTQNIVKILSTVQLLLAIGVMMCASLLVVWRLGAENGPWHDVAAAAVIVFPPAFLMGFGFPLGCKLVSGDPKALGRSIGAAYAANTIGCVVGPLAIGFVIIPRFGTNVALAAVASVSGITCVLLLATEPLKARRVAAIAASVTVSAAVISWGLRVNSTKALFVRRSDSVIFFREDPSGTVVATAVSHGIRLRVGGVFGAGTLPHFLGSTELLADVPLFLHPFPRKVAVIGFGTGRTSGLFAADSLVEQVDIAEISKSVLDAGRTVFADANGGVLSSRKVHTFIDDGFNFIRYVPRSYDVISVDMWTPWIAGSAPLYTREFWQSCLNRLNEHGMMVTWTFGAQTDEQAFKILLKTFQSIFGHTTVLLTPQDRYVLLLGSRDPIRVDSEKIRARLANRSPDAFPTFIPDERTFLAAFVAGEEQVRKYVGTSLVAVNTLDRPALRYPFPWSSVPERTAFDGIKELKAEEGRRPWSSSGPRNQ